MMTMKRKLLREQGDASFPFHFWCSYRDGEEEEEEEEEVEENDGDETEASVRTKEMVRSFFCFN